MTSRRTDVPRHRQQGAAMIKQLFAVMAAILVASLPIGAQTPKKYASPRTPWGDPVVSGF